MRRVDRKIEKQIELKRPFNHTYQSNTIAHYTHAQRTHTLTYGKRDVVCVSDLCSYVAHIWSTQNIVHIFGHNNDTPNINGWDYVPMYK